MYDIYYAYNNIYNIITLLREGYVTHKIIVVIHVFFIFAKQFFFAAF